MTLDLTNIDTSHWLTKDKKWADARVEQWPAIEQVVGTNRKKPEVNVIKQFYFRGMLPKWEKYRDWDNIFRPLDLNIFLWLHPSDDPKVLRPMHEVYMESDSIILADILAGYASFLGHELVRATAPYKTLEDYPFPYLGSKNIVVFRILFGDLDYAKSQIRAKIGFPQNFEETVEHIFGFLGYEHILKIRRWLLHDSNSPLGQNCLYQYDDVIDWVMTTITPSKETEFRDGLDTPELIESYQRALYCIRHFDTGKEGETGRTHAIRKISKILDEHEFINEFEQMWGEVKAGAIEVKDPW